MPANKCGHCIVPASTATPSQTRTATVMPTPTTSAGTVTATATATPTPTPIPCVGDCGGSHTVAVNDIITLVDIALGTAQPAACSKGGLPLGGKVNVAVIIQAVNNALTGLCGFCEGTAAPSRSDPGRGSQLRPHRAAPTAFTNLLEEISRRASRRALMVRRAAPMIDLLSEFPCWL